jgi:hypothetical protein
VELSGTPARTKHKKAAPLARTTHKVVCSATQ